MAPDDTPDTDTVARFAGDLRRLRLDADSPTLARLQHDAGVSRSVLSEAFAGRHLPSARTVDKLVRACGADPQAWLERRDALARGTAVIAEEDAPHPTGISRRAAVLLTAGAFAAGAAASALVTALMFPSTVASTVPEARSLPLIEVENGIDPGTSECVKDAAVAAAESRVDGTLLEIVWSDQCQAGWGRITRYDGLAAGNTVTIAIYPQTAPDGDDRQEATEHDVQGAYTHLVVRPTPDTLLCAEGSFTTDGETTDLGAPICI